MIISGQRVKGLFLVLFVICGGAMGATDVNRFAGGTGEALDPFLISTPDHLKIIGEDPNLWDQCFRLTQSINMHPNEPGSCLFERALIPVFEGRFDGQGHIIYNLNIRGGSFNGFIGMLLEEGELCNLRLLDIDIDCFEDAHSVGGLVGESWGNVANSLVTGKIKASDSVGPIVGTNWGTVTNCSSIVKVCGTSGLGGVVGANSHDAWISNCLSQSTIIPIHDANIVGGITGVNWGHISNCLATGTIHDVNEAGDFGGLIGEYGIGTITSSFWNMEPTGLSTASTNGETWLSSEEIVQSEIFLNAGWDLTEEATNGTADLWMMSSQGKGPELALFSDSIQPKKLSGKGTLLDPYEIGSVADFGAINHHSLTACYKLVSDINFADIQWSCAPVLTFSGQLDGNGYQLSNLTVDGSSYLGLFGALTSRSELTDITMNNTSIAGDVWSSAHGGIAGLGLGSIANCCVLDYHFYGNSSSVSGGILGVNKGSIASCSVTAVLEDAVGGYKFGGLVGENEGHISRSQAEIFIDEYYKDPDRTDLLGGLAGTNRGIIKECFSLGFVEGHTYTYIGGLVGANWEGIIMNSYSHTKTSGYHSGGVVGFHFGGSIINCYDTGNYWYLAARNQGGDVQASFWEDEYESWLEDDTALTVTEMRDPNSFLSAGWDFVGETENGTADIWYMPEGDYPHLSWEMLEP